MNSPADRNVLLDGLDGGLDLGARLTRVREDLGACGTRRRRMPANVPRPLPHGPGRRPRPVSLAATGIGALHLTVAAATSLHDLLPAPVALVLALLRALGHRRGGGRRGRRRHGVGGAWQACGP